MLMGGVILGTSMTFAQNVNVSGVVYAEDGEPVVGASVKVDGTKTGTVTNIDGKFELAIPADKKKSQFLTLVCRQRPLRRART